MQIVRVRAGLALAVLSLAGTQASAQTAVGQAPSPDSNPKVAPSDSDTVQQIVVTANKRQELARTVANSVTAITGRTLDQRQQVRLQDLVGQVPGLSVEADSTTAVRIVLRGLNTGSGGATAASVLDDVPTNATGAQNNAAINTPNFDTYDLNRIEVLQGPQSTLYGATAEGGIIKYVTNAPELNKYSGQLESGIDGTTVGGIGGSLKGFANLPLIPNLAAARISAWNEWLPGYVDNPQAGKTNTNAAHQYGWRASLLVTPTQDLSIRFMAERQTLFSDNQDSIQSVGAAFNPLAPPTNQLSLINGYRNNTAFRSPSQNEAGVYYVNLTNDFHFATLTSVTSYSFNNFKNFSDVSNTDLAAGTNYSSYLGSQVYGAPIYVDERQNSNVGKFNQEVRLTSDPGWQVFGNELQWIGGFYFTHENTSFLQALDGLSQANPRRVLSPALGGEDLFGRLSEWAVFGSVDYHLIPTVDVAVGGRFEGNTQYSQATSIFGALFPAAGAFPPISTNEHDALYSVAPRWRPSDRTTVYARLATGYRPGGPNIPVPGITGVPSSYSNDRVVNYEAGIRQDFFHKKLAVDLTGFWVDWYDVQVLSLINTPSGPFFVNGNAGQAHSRGAEWDVAWVPLRRLRIEATGEYVNSTLTANAPGLGGFKGQALPYVPAISANVNVDYRWDLTDKLQAYVSGTWTFTGARYTNFSSSPSVIESHVKLSSYNTGALRGGLSLGRYNLEGFLNNISNARGIASYTNNNGADQTGQVVLIQPRTIGLVGRVNF